MRSVKSAEYPFLKNIDNVPEKSFSVQELWGNAKHIRFNLKQPSRKSQLFSAKGNIHSFSPSSFGICSYPPEDIIVEQLGDFLKQKGKHLTLNEEAHVRPLSSSLEDGIDIRETIRHWHEKTLFVKKFPHKQAECSSVVVIFDEDGATQTLEKYPWKMTWIGEHNQESDMAFYSTFPGYDLVGPGISRSRYGGFMLTAPPRRLADVWTDPDYSLCQKKAEVLLLAAIDYALTPVIVYVAPTPPTHKTVRICKSFWEKKIQFVPLRALSPKLLQRVRIFHVLDGHDKREIAGDYII